MPRKPGKRRRAAERRRRVVERRRRMARRRPARGGGLPPAGPMSPPPRPEDTEEGWLYQAVFDPDGEAPPWGYTIGLPERHGLPELLLGGVPPQVGHGVVVSLLERVEEAGGLPPPGEPIERVLRDSFPVAWVPLPAMPFVNLHVMGRAFEHHGGQPFEAALLLLPDAQRRLPGEQGFEAGPQGWLLAAVRADVEMVLEAILQPPERHAEKRAPLQALAARLEAVAVPEPVDRAARLAVDRFYLEAAANDRA